MARSASMSPGTQARNLAMPNQWHDQHQCLHGHKYATINAKPMARSAINVYTDTSMQLSMPNQWHGLQFICLEQGQDYSLSVIKAEPLYQLSIFRDVRLKLGFISVITS